MIVEKSYLKPGSDNLKTFEEFQNNENITIVKNNNPAIFHNKFIIRDKDKNTAAILTGSTNFTDTGTRRNFNHIFIIHFKGEKKNILKLLRNIKKNLKN